MRPADLAREHGLSAQAVRNYEADGVLPPAPRSSTGYRDYGPVHVAALRAFLALVRALGYGGARGIMRALVAEDLDGALRGIDAGHDQLARDRATLDTVAQAAEDLAEHRRQPGPGQQSGPEQQSGPGRRPGIGPGPASTSTFPWSIGQVASRLAVTSATLRHWERIGLLRPPREPHHGRRLFGPEDVRDAELVHLLRRAGHGLDGIAVVLRALREAPGTTELTDALEESREHLQQRGLSLLRASAAIADCLPHLGLETPRNLRV